MKNLAALAAFVLAACQAERVPPAINIEDAWARAAAPGQASTAVYFTIANPGGEDRLIGVSSPAGEASLHSTTIDQGVMRMRPLESLDIPAGSSVVLEPQGTHVMISRLQASLAPGSTIRIDLDFERSADRQVDVPVRSAWEGSHR